MAAANLYDRNQQNYTPVNLLVGDYWLTSSKIARKAGHFQAAYSALLQGRHRGAPYHFIQGCKLLTGTGDSIRALQELNNSLVLTDDGTPEIVIDLTESDEQRRMRAKVCLPLRCTQTITHFAKAFLLRARWMQASERFSRAELNARFNYVTQLYEGRVF
jgi:serine/threonine-protein kinase ATR